MAEAVRLRVGDVVIDSAAGQEVVVFAIGGEADSRLAKLLPPAGTREASS